MSIKGNKIIVFDLETTGTNVIKDQIIQLAFGFYENGNLVKPQTLLFKPSIEISKGAEEIHGYSNESLADKQPFKNYAKQLRDIFSKADGFMGYNVNFDIQMFQAELIRADLPPLNLKNLSIFDAYIVWTKHEGRSLTDAVERFTGKEMVNAHDALADITATKDVFNAMIEEFELQDFEDADFTDLFRGNKIDFSGVFRWVDNKIVMGIGKFKDQEVINVAKKGNYLQWIIRNDFSHNVKMICKKALLYKDEEPLFVEWVIDNFGKPNVETLKT
jgi:DNA polymerase-3 subunit epsilon